MLDALTARLSFVIDDVQKLEGQTGTTSFRLYGHKDGATGFATAVQFQTFDGNGTVADSDLRGKQRNAQLRTLETSETGHGLVNGDYEDRANENSSFAVE